MEELQVTWGVVSQLLIAIATIGGATLVLSRWGDKAKRPFDELKDEVEELQKQVGHLEGRIDEHEEKLDNDHERFGQVVEGQNVLCECMLQVMNHLYDGNHTEELKGARDNMQHYLVNRRSGC